VAEGLRHLFVGIRWGGASSAGGSLGVSSSGRIPEDAGGRQHNALLQVGPCRLGGAGVASGLRWRTTSNTSSSFAVSRAFPPLTSSALLGFC
jgi:hypothetical protein